MTCARSKSEAFTFSVALPADTYSVKVNDMEAAESLLKTNYLSPTPVVVAEPIANLLVDETAYAVSGVVTINGATPTRDALCNQAANANTPLYILAFEDEKQNFSLTQTLTCGNTASGFKYSVSLPPSTFNVRVQPTGPTKLQGVRGQEDQQPQVQPLPRPPQFVAALEADTRSGTALVVSGPISNKVLDGIGRVVTGTLTLNGAPPTRNTKFCGDAANLERQLAFVQFTQVPKAFIAPGVRFDMTCRTTNSNGFQWAVMVPPGTYDVTVGTFPDAAAAGVHLPRYVPVTSGVLVP